MTKLDEFRSWLYAYWEEVFHYDVYDMECPSNFQAIQNVIDEFEAQFADELKTEDEVVEES